MWRKSFLWEGQNFLPQGFVPPNYTYSIIVIVIPVYFESRDARVCGKDIPYKVLILRCSWRILLKFIDVIHVDIVTR